MKAGIVGLGVIGSSIGLALKKTGLFEQVWGFDSQPRTARQSLGFGCIHVATDTLAALSVCDRVFVAVPPGATIGCLEELERHRSEQTLVTDCTSVKGFVWDWACQEGERESWFVGGHPMAGNEGQGPEAADGELFAGSTWVLTPGEDPRPPEAFEPILHAIGATPVKTTAVEHDVAVAVTSHLPHLLASTLVHLAAGLPKSEFRAGSWRDLTRVAGANPALWSQILITNRSSVLAALDGFARFIDEARTAIEGNDLEAVCAFFEEARLIKNRGGGGQE